MFEGGSAIELAELSTAESGFVGFLMAAEVGIQSPVT